MNKRSRLVLMLTIILSLSIVLAAVAQRASSTQQSQGQPGQTMSMQDMMQECQKHCEAASNSIDSLNKEIEAARQSNDPAKMRAALDKAQKSLMEMKDRMNMGMSMMKMMGNMRGEVQPSQQSAKKEHIFRGKVEKIDANSKAITVSGQKVEGWMNAMTMSYAVDKEAAFKTIKVGDEITAKVYDGDFKTLYDVQIVPAKDTKTPAKK